TGASRGLGLMIGTALAAAGYRVIAIARHETAELRAAAAAASEAQRGALEFRAFDLAQIGAIAKLAASLHEEYGPLYGLVNNAGIGTAGVLGLMPDAAIAELLRLNVESPDRKSTRLNSSHLGISYAAFCLKKKKPHHGQVRGARRLRVRGGRVLRGRARRAPRYRAEGDLRRDQRALADGARGPLRRLSGAR